MSIISDLQEKAEDQGFGHEFMDIFMFDLSLNLGSDININNGVITYLAQEAYKEASMVSQGLHGQGKSIK